MRLRRRRSIRARFGMITLHVYWDDEPHAFRLGDGEHGVGRAACPVQIMESGVSKHHAMLRVEGDRLFVRDLGSRNGTLLDGLPVGIEYQEVAWDAEMLFADTRAHRVRPDAAGITDEETSDRTVFQTEQSFHLSDGYSDTARTRIVKMLSGLFDFLGTREDPQTIEDDACRFVASCIKAERVLLLEDSGPGSPLVPIARWTPRGPSDEPIRLSSTIVNLVHDERRSVLIRDALKDPRTWDAESVATLNVRSAMAAPLFDNERVR